MGRNIITKYGHPNFIKFGSHLKLSGIVRNGFTKYNPTIEKNAPTIICE
jgi:hypothetical protein